MKKTTKTNKTPLAPPLSADVPDGAPKFNPLTAEDYQALVKLNDNLHVLADLLARAHDIGLEVGLGGDERTGQAATYEMHHGVMHRTLKNFPPPAGGPLDL